MRNYTRNVLIAIFVTAIFCTFWFAGTYPKAFYYIDVAFNRVTDSFRSAKENIAVVLLHKPITVFDLQNSYNTSNKKRIRILIVPGHEPDYGGTEYRDLKEREMNVELSGYLSDFLKSNGHYDVMVARDNKEWNPILLNYFQTQWNEIITFFRDNKQETIRLINAGIMTQPVEKVFHNAARTDVALRLFGINKWENENAVDIAVHVHFNDYSRRNTYSAGEYSGFTMYVPEQQYANSTTTQAIAKTVFSRLAKYNAVSNLRIEDEGIVEDTDLIAIGAFNTTNAASMLIEYGYIYEPQFQNDTVRHSTLKDLAFQTYLGLQDFFGSGKDVSYAYDTIMLPYYWKSKITPGNATPEDGLALQSALILDGEYPGIGKTKNDCPRTGKIGPCTLGALGTFQKKYGIKGEEGFIGEKTRDLLNGRYSMKPI